MKICFCFCCDERYVKNFYGWTGWLLKEIYQDILFAKCTAHDIEIIDRGGGTFQIITISLKGGLSRLIRPRHRPSLVSCMKLSVSLSCLASIKSSGLLLGWFRGSSHSLSSQALSRENKRWHKHTGRHNYLVLNDFVIRRVIWFHTVNSFVLFYPFFNAPVFNSPLVLKYWEHILPCPNWSELISTLVFHLPYFPFQDGQTFIFSFE